MPRLNVKDKRKQQLIDANVVSIAKRGLADTTITHVSEGANLSRGIVNFYFDSKEKMMQETLAHLLAEHDACWQEALNVAAQHSPMEKIQAVMRSLLSDHQCSMRRLAAMSAFIAHAGTHAGYAKMLRASDEMFTKQLKQLFQLSGCEAKASDLHARQVLSFIRGHHIVAFLNPDWGKPSAFTQMWSDMLRIWTGQGVALQPAEKPVIAKAAPVQTAAKPKKTNPNTLPGQLDFADLFAKT